MTRIVYKKLFSLHDPQDVLRSKKAGIYQGSDGKFYLCDGNNSPMSFLEGAPTSGGTIGNETLIYDEDLQAFVIKE